LAILFLFHDEPVDWGDGVLLCLLVVVEQVGVEDILAPYLLEIVKLLVGECADSLVDFDHAVDEGDALVQLFCVEFYRAL
jgi:hypothetical protein